MCYITIYSTLYIFHILFKLNLTFSIIYYKIYEKLFTIFSFKILARRNTRIHSYSQNNNIQTLFSLSLSLSIATLKEQIER